VVFLSKKSEVLSFRTLQVIGGVTNLHWSG